MKNEMRHSTKGRLERIKVSCLLFTMLTSRLFKHWSWYLTTIFMASILYPSLSIALSVEDTFLSLGLSYFYYLFWPMVY